MLNATVLANILLSERLFILRILPDYGVPEFIPGQYLVLGLPCKDPRRAGSFCGMVTPPPSRLIRRTYSIGSAPHQKEYLEFLIAVVPGGALSGRMACLAQGDRLYAARRPAGKFTLKTAAPGSRLIFAASGSGVAPFVSMLRAMGTWPCASEVVLIHGARNRRELAYEEELRVLAAERDSFVYEPILSRPEADWVGKSGYVQSLFESGELHLNAARDHIYLCGHPGLIQESIALLTKAGFVPHSAKEPGNLHIEKYW